MFAMPIDPLHSFSSGFIVRSVEPRDQGLGIGIAGTPQNFVCGTCSTILPRFMTTTRSQSNRTTLRSWETNIYSSQAHVSDDPRVVKPTPAPRHQAADVGSSRIRSLGLTAMARLSRRGLFVPPESWCGKRLNKASGRPTRSANASTFSRIRVLSRSPVRRFSGSAMLSWAEYRGLRLSVGSWKTI